MSIKKIFSVVALLGVGLFTAFAFTPDEFGLELCRIPSGSFSMGANYDGAEADEQPIHNVTLTSDFWMSRCEITNRQYEMFCPEHKLLRGKDGVSKADDEAVTNVTWHDAVAFCKWLSEQTGRRFRLPTEAEWEYACRGGSNSPYFTGDTLPAEMLRNQTIARDYGQVDLSVGKTQPNSFGLCDMHGNVEEWCTDWYAPYAHGSKTNPFGAATGEFKVTRGGSHNTPVKYLRSSKRMAMIPSDSHSLTGFRVVMTDQWAAPSEAPLFVGPQPYIHAPADSTTPLYSHNHQPALTWTDDGDLLATWFSADAENGREMVVLSSRLVRNMSEWQPAELFFKVPGRNMTGTSLLNDGQGRLLHINGVEAAGDWQNLALILRESIDGGRTWTPARIIAPNHTKRHQAIAGAIVGDSAWLIQACDAGPGSHDGTAIHISRDGGQTWVDPWDGVAVEEFKQGQSGSTIAGIHAGVAQRSDGALVAFGRGNSIPDKKGTPRMPMSVSSDYGKSWTYHASQLPPIDGGQRLVLMRLPEGPLLIVSFTEHPERTPLKQRGLTMTRPDGKTDTCHGLYAALSFDGGLTWPVKRLLSDASGKEYDGGAWTGKFTADQTHAEPMGYLAGTRTPDGTIHLLSSALHYQFNLPWLLQYYNPKK